MTVPNVESRFPALLRAPAAPSATAQASAVRFLLDGAGAAPDGASRGDAGAPIARVGDLSVSVAGTPQAVERALRLRYRVFADELGARIGARDGLDRDIFDPYCRHLVVTDHASGEVVGTYRVMLPEQARLLGCLYADREFWLTRLNPLRDSIVELGRACVHPAYRTGATIMLLWSGIGALLASCGHRYLLGSVSVPLSDGGVEAVRLYRTLAQRHLADETLRVWPRQRLLPVPPEAAADPQPMEDPAAPLEHSGAATAQAGAAGSSEIVIPPLMRGYLRAGAKLLGEPSRDDEFGCADFPMMLRLDELTGRHRRRFMQ